METHDEIMELLGAYALDAVDDDERRTVEVHLAECPRCAAEVADHREVAAMLAHTGGDAPEGVWDRIEASLEETPPAFRMPTAGEPLVVEPGDELAERRQRRDDRRPILVAAAAAAVALVIGLFGGTLIADDGTGGGPDQEVAGASLDELARDALNDPASTKVDLASPEDESVTAAAAVEPDGSGYLLGTSLPALDAGQTYQLWGEREGTVVSLGVLGHEPDVVAFHTEPGTETLMITQEVAGGVPVSENPAVLVGTVS